MIKLVFFIHIVRYDQFPPFLFLGIDVEGKTVQESGLGEGEEVGGK